MANLNSLAALAALGYMASRGFGGGNNTTAPTSTGAASQAPQAPESEPTGVEGGDQYLGQPTGAEDGDQYIPQKSVRNASSSSKPATKSKASAQGNPRDREAGMSRGTQYGSSAYQTPSYTGQGGSGRGGQGGPTANELARYVQLPTSAQTQAGLETMMGGGPGLKAMSSMARGLAGRKAAQEALTGGRALATTETPVTFVGSSGARQVGGYDGLPGTARQAIQNNPTRQIANNPTRQLPNSPSGSVAQKAAETPAKKALDESDWTGGAVGYRKGGAVKKMAKGGLTSKPVSNASRRADGIATKGKTRGKIY